MLAKSIWQAQDSAGSLLWYLPTWGSSAMVLFRLDPNSRMPSAICGRKPDHIFVGYLGTYDLVLGINMKLSFSLFNDTKDRMSANSQ